MNSQTKEKRKRPGRLRVRNKTRRIKLIKKAKGRFDAQKLRPPLKKLAPVPKISPEKVTAEIREIETWIEEVKKLEVKEDTNIDKDETILLLRKMFKELMQEAVPDETIRILDHKIHKVIQQKRNETANLKRLAKSKQKQLNRRLNLKHYDGSAAGKLLELVSERKVENVEQIRGLLDRIWRKSMNGSGTTTGKDFEAIEAAQSFLREVNSQTS